jgi:glutathione S-transferase
MYASKYVFGKTFFVAWIVIAIIWVWGTMFVAGFYPIIDGWPQLKKVYKGLRGRDSVEGRTEVVHDPPSDSSINDREDKGNSGILA